jgi:hypothetical protein
MDRQVTAAATLQGFLDPTQDKKATYRSERESRMTTMENTTVAHTGGELRAQLSPK